jgi:hypothetical protein
LIAKRALADCATWLGQAAPLAETA